MYESVPYEDSAKAQSLAYTMTSIGSVLASLVGGFLFDHTTVTNTLWISFGICFVAAVIAFLGVEKDQP